MQALSTIVCRHCRGLFETFENLNIWMQWLYLNSQDSLQAALQRSVFANIVTFHTFVSQLWVDPLAWIFCRQHCRGRFLQTSAVRKLQPLPDLVWVSVQRVQVSRTILRYCRQCCMQRSVFWKHVELIWTLNCLVRIPGLWVDPLRSRGSSEIGYCKDLSHLLQLLPHLVWTVVQRVQVSRTTYCILYLVFFIGTKSISFQNNKSMNKDVEKYKTVHPLFKRRFDWGGALAGGLPEHPSRWSVCRILA